MHRPDDTMTTWKALLDAAFAQTGESWSDVVVNTMTTEEMDRQFDAGYGSPQGIPFTVWTQTTVYFPHCYDGEETVAFVARHPNGEPTPHIGGL